MLLQITVLDSTVLYTPTPSQTSLPGKCTQCFAEVKDRMAVLFHAHPEKPNGTAIDRIIKVDMEAGYKSNEFADSVAHLDTE